MLNGGRTVKITLWPVCFSNSAAMAFAAICVDPTLSTRTSAAVARVDEATWHFFFNCLPELPEELTAGREREVPV
jgi:hypothetical protein